MSQPFSLANRPTYETQNDRLNEITAKNIIESLWGITIEMNPPKYEIDYQLFNGDRCIGWGEYKNRSRDFKWLMRNGYMISMLKWMRLKDFADKTGLKSFIFVKTTDTENEWKDLALSESTRVYWHSVNDINEYPNVCRFWSSKRGDPQDMEPAVNIPFDNFNLMKKI